MYITKTHPEPARQSEQSDCSTGKCACDPEQINANHVSQLHGPLALTYELQKDDFLGARATGQTPRFNQPSQVTSHGHVLTPSSAHRLPSFERLDSWFSAIEPQMGSLLSSIETRALPNKLPFAGFWVPSCCVDFRKASPVNSFGQFPWDVPGTDCMPNFPHQMRKLCQTCPPYPGILDGTCFHKSECRCCSVYKISHCLQPFASSRGLGAKAASVRSKFHAPDNPSEHLRRSLNRSAASGKALTRSVALTFPRWRDHATLQLG